MLKEGKEGQARRKKRKGVRRKGRKRRERERRGGRGMGEASVTFKLPNAAFSRLCLPYVCGVK